MCLYYIDKKRPAKVELKWIEQHIFKNVRCCIGKFVSELLNEELISNID